MPKYTGLRDFVRGCQKLLKIHGNIPVFLEVADGQVAPFGLALTSSELLGGEAIVLKGGCPGSMKTFKKGDCTE